MRSDYTNIKTDYESILPLLDKLCKQLQEQLIDAVNGITHIDRITCRPKGIDSFMLKSEKTNKDGSLKYKVPLKEIQDQIGARIVVYCKTDVEPVKEKINSYYRQVEQTLMVPEDVTKFGYEGFHMVCFLPNTIFSSRDNSLVNDFFELQIKTLFQHAWSQSNHGLGYKPGSSLKPDEERMLAFIAAQSWGADKALVDLVSGSLKK